MTDQKPDDVLAYTVAAWLTSKGCVTALVEVNEGWEVHYTLPEDIKPQPPVQVHNGKIIFPKGSQEDVVFTFLLSQ